MSCKSDLNRLSEIYGWHVYVISEEGGEFSKVGTSLRPNLRIDGLQNGNPRPLRLVAIWHLKTRGDALLLEARILARLGEARLSRRDWVRQPASVVIDELRATIKSRGITAQQLPLPGKPDRPLSLKEKAHARAPWWRNRRREQVAAA